MGIVRVALVHGFTQTAASWDTVAGLLEDEFEIVRPELPGHGGRADDRLEFPAAAASLGTAGEAVYVGYSMGGRLVLRLALDRPDLVRAAVLIGASPGIDDPVARSLRHDAEDELAVSIERGGVDAFLEGWLAQPLFATLPGDAAGLEERRRNTAAGLATSLRLLGSGSQQPLWDRLATLRPPTLLIAGALDEKYAVLAGEISDATGAHVVPAIVDGAGHAVHLERPEVVAGLVRDFALAATG